MRVLEELCDILEFELKDITKKGDISPAELDNVYKSVDIIKDIETIKAMKSQDGYSYGSYNSYDGSYEGSYMMGGSNAGRRGMDRDGDGRYSERRGMYASRNDGYNREYSREQETEALRKELVDMNRKLDRM